MTMVEVRVIRVTELPDGETIRVDVDKFGNSIVWMLASHITAEGAEALGVALAASRANYRRLALAQQPTRQAA